MARLSRVHLEKLAAAYDLGLDEGTSPRVKAWARAQASRVHQEFEKLTRKIDVHFTERDPYASFAELAADVEANRRMFVYTGGSDTPLWDEKTNWMARAVHDWDHIEGKFDFSVEGEIGAYRYSAKRAPGLAPLYLSEIALQAASSALIGFQPGAQKVVVPPDEIVRIADSFTANKRKKGALVPKVVSTESLAIRLARFMRPEDIPVHLGAARAGKTNAIVATVGAEIVTPLRRRQS